MKRCKAFEYALKNDFVLQDEDGEFFIHKYINNRRGLSFIFNCPYCGKRLYKREISNPFKIWKIKKLMRKIKRIKYVYIRWKDKEEGNYFGQ